MAIQPIRLFGDPVLRKPAVEVVDFDKELRRLVAGPHRHDARGARARGWRHPRSASGCGSSPGTSRARSATWSTRRSGCPRSTQDGPEGCLSIPGLSIDCTRALSVVAHGFDMYGEPVTVEGSELLARAIQHETDHLDGVLFIDRLDPANRKARDEGDPRVRVVRPGGAPTVKVSPHPTGGLGL